MAPPTGPRGGTTTASPRNTRSSTGGTRGSQGGSRGRGGIAKRGRSATARVDRDGDLVMDASAGAKSGARVSKSNNTANRRGSSRPNGPTRTSGPKSNPRLQQNIVRHLGGDTSQVPRAPSARIASNNTTLKVLGLKSSRAVTNSDGGVKDLLLFLEKKATNIKNTNGSGRTSRPVLIKKVCHVSDQWVRRVVQYHTKVHTRCSVLSLAERADNYFRLSPLLPHPCNPGHRPRFLFALLTPE